MSEILMTAVKAGDLKEIQLLLSEGAKLEYTDKEGFNVLLVAVLCGHESIVDYLLAQGARLSPDENTSIFLDAYEEEKEKLELRIENEKNPEILEALNAYMNFTTTVNALLKKSITYAEGSALQ